MAESNTDVRLDALVEAYRFGEVGRCVNSVTHDANNSLGVILAYSELVGMEPDIGAESQRMLNEIAVATRKVSEQLSWLTDVARPAPSKPSSARVSVLVDRVVALRHYEVKHKQVDLDVRVPGDLPEVSVDVPAIQRALMYLLVNALDAVAVCETKRVRIEGASNAGFVTIQIRDSADVIADADAVRMFDPFFTTKDGNHLGIGLYAARLTTESNGGSLTYEPDSGFRMALPTST